MTDPIYVAGDFSGIQDYVLGITAAGGGQARRLRARSFWVQMLGAVAVHQIRQVLGDGSCEELVNGGGQFLLRVPASFETRLSGLLVGIERRLFEEFSGELGISLVCAPTLPEVLDKKERAKRCLWKSHLTTACGWLTDRMHGPAISQPCDICRKHEGSPSKLGSGEEVLLCPRCEADIQAGIHLQRRSAVHLSEPPASFQLLGTGVVFQEKGHSDPAAQPFDRHVPVDREGNLLTFDQIAQASQGDSLLGVLKADVDNMGMKVAEVIQQDPTYRRLKEFSAELDEFFSARLQANLRNPPSDTPAWGLIYTVYSGGDDVLLVGPWDVLLDFACGLEDGFKARFRARHGLTISAGVSLTRHGVPIRYAVERADRLLEEAKGGDKNQCSSLGAVATWDRFRVLLGDGRKIQKWITTKVCNRTLVQRLYTLASSDLDTKPGLWAQQVGRNFPRPDDRRPEARAFRRWGEDVLGSLRPGRMAEISASLLYGLTSTRNRRS